MVSYESPKLPMEAYLPVPCVQNHAANLLEMPNGDLLCVWFAGTQEGIPDISIYMSRLTAGTTEWSKPHKMSDDPARSEQNPVLFMTPDHKVWLFWTAQISGNQNTSIVRRRVSLDQGHTWGPIEVMFDRPGTFVRQPPCVNSVGEILVPVFYCVSQRGKPWVGDFDYSAVMISADGGQSWREIVVPESLGCVHMNIVKASGAGRKWLAFFRSRWADSIYRSFSSDDGGTWTAPEAIALPNNNSSIQCIRLQSGCLAMIYNHNNSSGCSEKRQSLYDDIEMEAAAATTTEPVSLPATIGLKDRQAFWGAPRAPLSIALSIDEGDSWQPIRNIEVGDGYCLTNNSKEGLNREFSYPSICQGEDGKIHIAYTYFRQKIKYARISEAWLRE